MALPMVAMAAPAMARDTVDLSGNWLVTLTTVRPVANQGTSACFTLTQTSSFQNWMNSGTFTIAGTSVVGTYYAVNSVLTGFATLPGDGFLLLSGHLYHHGIENTSFLEIVGGAPSSGNFSASSGC
jgi:hypothetical protein